MGSVLAPAPIDSTVEKVMKKFLIPKGKIQSLWGIFCSHCQENGDGDFILSTSIFLQDILNYPPSPLTDALPVFFETKSDSFLYFGEFVEIVCQFCFFEQVDLLRYIFNVLDADKMGTVEKKIFKHFFIAIWRHKPYDTLREAMEYLDRIEDTGNYTYRQYMGLRNLYPLIFYPMYAFQHAIISSTFGEFWWTHHKAFYLDEQIRLQKKQERFYKQKAKEDEQRKFKEHAIQEEMVRLRMGLLFYITPWRRPLERQRIARIAAWEDELDRMIDDVGIHSEKIVRLASLSKTKSDSFS